MPNENRSLNALNNKDNADEYKDEEALDEYGRPVQVASVRGELLANTAASQADGQQPDDLARLETIMGTLITLDRSEEWILLQHLAWLDFEFISEELLLALVENDQAKLWRTIESLEKLSLIKVIYRGDTKGLTIVREVQDLTVSHAKSNPHISKDVSKLLEDMLVVLNKFLPEVENKLDENWERAKAYAPTVEALLQHSTNRKTLLPENKDLSLLNAKLGMFYEIISEDAKKSLAYKERVLKINSELYEYNDPNVVEALKAVGSAHHKLGDVKQALARFETALVAEEDIYGKGHPVIANTLDSLGTLYLAQGEKTKEALASFEEALRIREAIYQKAPSDAAKSLVVQSLNNMWLAHKKLGQLEDSFDNFYKQALSKIEGLYPGNHPDVARFLDYMGLVYKELGQLDDSFDDSFKYIEYLQRALKMREDLYQQRNHPDIATSLSNVGDARIYLSNLEDGCNKLIDVKQAFGYYERALIMRLNLYPGNHPDVAASLNCYEGALSMILDLYPSNNPDVAASLNRYKGGFGMKTEDLYPDENNYIVSSLRRVGIAYCSLKDYKKALDYYEQALKTSQAFYKGDHPDTAWCLHYVGEAYYSLRDYSKALDYCEQTLKMRQALYKGDNGDVAWSLNSVGKAHHSLGDYRKALDYYEPALKMRQALYKGYNLLVAESLNNVGTAYYNLGDYRKALDHYEPQQAFYSARNEDPYVAQLLHNTGNAYYNLRIYRKALDYYERALVMRQALYPGNHPNVAISLNSVGCTHYNLGNARMSLDHHEQALAMRQALYPGNHPKVVVSLKNVGTVYQELGDGEKANDYFERANKMKEALKEKEEFKGQGTLSYAIDGRLEYYNGALDQILGLRLGGIGYTGKIVVLQSRYFGEDFAADGLAYDVKVILSGGNVKAVLAPINLYNKHWLGLLFKEIGTRVEVSYMDSEQRTMPSLLKSELENGLSRNGYKSHFLELKLEQQRYNNCGPELVENFAYYLTGTRATQDTAVYVHSLLVENSLLNQEEYGLKITENNKLIGFLSNAVPLPIRSIDIRPNAKTAPIHHCEERSFAAIHLNRITAEDGLPASRSSESVVGPRAANNDELAINLLPAIQQFNRFWAKWAQDCLRQVNALVHKTTMGFKGLDFAVDSARLLYKPDFMNARSVALDASYLYSMIKGVNGYSALVGGAEVAYQLYLVEYHKAFNTGAATVNAMALPYILAICNRPYLGLAYGVWIAAATAYNAALNAYSFVLELKESDTFLKSTMAYKELIEWLAASPLQGMYDFEAHVTEYKLKVNDLFFEKEKAVIKAKAEGKFGQKIFDYVYLPKLTEKYNLLSDIIKGILTAEEAESLQAKHIAIASQQQHYECVEIRYTEDNTGDDNIKNYHCFNMDNQLLDHFTISNDGAIRFVEHL